VRNNQYPLNDPPTPFANMRGMLAHPPERYVFGAFTLDVPERRLSRGATPIQLSPKTFDVLLALVREAGQLVSKNDLLGAVWPNTFVEEGILTVHVAALRKRLGDTARGGAFIETVSRYGYRFVAPVHRRAAPNNVNDITLHRSTAASEFVECGRQRLLTGSYFELESAAEAFQAAIDLDHAYAPAYAWLALARCEQAHAEATATEHAYDDAKRAALRALALDDRSAEAQLALATVLFFSEWDWVGAERSLRRTLELDPECVEAYLRYGTLMEVCGRLDEGLRVKLQALEREPASTQVLAQIASSYWCQRKFDEAIVWTQRALDRDATHASARTTLAFALWKIGKYDRMAETLLAQAESFGVAADTMIRVDAKSRRSPEDRVRWPFGVVRYVLDNLPRAGGGASAATLAVAKGERGEMDAAFDCLDVAITEREPGVIHLAVAPQWDTLRRDPRFERHLARLGLPLLPQADEATH